MIAVAVLTAMLLAGWHHASVQHGRCVEHGEELHLSKVGKALLAPTTDVAQISASPWAAVEGDEHCEISAVAHQPFHGAADVVLDVAPAAIATAALPPPPIVAIAAAVYRLAPKTSPPVA